MPDGTVSERKGKKGVLLVVRGGWASSFGRGNSSLIISMVGKGPDYSGKKEKTCCGGIFWKGWTQASILVPERRNYS